MNHLSRLRRRVQDSFSTRGKRSRRSRPDRRLIADRRSIAGRRLRTEALEKRELLAGDFDGLLPAHNYLNRHDVNRDGQVTVLDALVGINGLRNGAGEAELTADGSDGMMYDVNGDRMHSVLDSLQVLNAMDAGEQISELVEYKLSARTLGDQPLDIDGNGIIDVGTEIGLNEPFKLEVAYDDLRSGLDELGIFRLAVDLGVSSGGILRPVLREAQRIKLGSEIRNASSGELTLRLEGGTQEVTLTLDELGRASSPHQLFVDALVSLGYESDEIQGSRFVFEDQGGVGVEIRYVATEFGNVDMPDLIVTPNFDVEVPLEFEEYSPLEDDGVTPNAEAMRFNIETNSRTFNNNSPFYASLNTGGFQLETGFDEITGVGLIPSDGGGVPNLTDDGDFIEPFDALAVEVYLAQSIPQGTGLTVDVNPGESLEALLLYGSDNAISSDFILLDQDSVVRFRDGTHPLPIFLQGPVTASFAEADAVGTVDLLSKTFVSSGVSLSVSNLNTTGDTSGLTVNDNIVTIDPSAYESLQRGDVELIQLDYQVSDGASSVAQTATITIHGETINDAPIVDRPITVTIAGDEQPVVIDLLTHASDPDGDPLQVTDVAFGSLDKAGGTIDLANNQLVFDPSVYPGVLQGQIATVVYVYQITDGLDSVQQRLTVKVSGVTDNPTQTVADPIHLELSEDDAFASLDLLFGAVDRSGDGLSTSGLLLVSGNDSGVFLDEGDSRIDIFPETYRYLGDGESEVIVYAYSVVDGGISTDQIATITIRGVNDAPIVSPETRYRIQLAGSSVEIDLLADAFDYEGDDLDAVLRNALGDVSGFVFADGSVSIDPNAYSYLLTGETAAVTLSYGVADGSAETVQTTRIEIVGNGVPGSTVYGDLFLDQIDNLDQLLGGAEPRRNGARDANEPGLAGLSVTLTPVGPSGVTYRAVSDATGRYSVSNVPAGTYTIAFDMPESVIAAGPMSRTVTVSGEVGALIHGGDVSATGFRGDMQHADLLALTYIRAGITNSAALGTGGVVMGGTVSLGSSGEQEFVVLSDGFEGVRFAELTLNAAHDSALLSVVDSNGAIKSATLSGERFVANADGTMVQFFGAMGDFEFQTEIDAQIVSRFAHYVHAVHRDTTTIAR